MTRHFDDITYEIVRAMTDAIALVFAKRKEPIDTFQVLSAASVIVGLILETAPAEVREQAIEKFAADMAAYARGHGPTGTNH